MPPLYALRHTILITIFSFFFLFSHTKTKTNFNWVKSFICSFRLCKRLHTTHLHSISFDDIVVVLIFTLVSFNYSHRQILIHVHIHVHEQFTMKYFVEIRLWEYMRWTWYFIFVERLCLLPKTHSYTHTHTLENSKLPFFLRIVTVSLTVRT